MHDPYTTCHGCPRRLTNGANCHNAEYCPGWGYREEVKAQRYATAQAEIEGAVPMSVCQKAIITKNVLQKKGGRRP